MILTDAQKAPFVITREFGAPRTRVWAAWTDPERLPHWWGPAGCMLDVLKFEFRPGGFFHYAMHNATMPTMWGRFMYRAIDDGRQIAWLNSFANEHGGITRAPFSPVCPLEMDNLVEFVDTASGGTRITLRAQPFGAPVEDVLFFDQLRPSMEMGFGGTMDALATYLSENG